MPGGRNQIIKQLLEIWARLGKSQRLTIIGFGAAVFAGLSILVFFLNRVDYEVLYRDLNTEDAQAIAAKLKEEKRDYLVQGTSILVAGPKTDVDKLRLEIAGSGLARSGRVGYEIFDKSQFGMTDFTEQVNLQRALEGELARTISSLAEISQARVHLVLPKESIFEDKRQEAKASVAVRLKNGNELSKPSISGIKGLVAGAVPGLKPYSISIVDDEGKLLSQPPPSDATLAEAESGIREQLEKEMVAKVLSILEPAVGTGKVQAKASVELDFNTTEQTEESFNPNPAAIVSQQKSEERLGSANTASGIPGNPPAKEGTAGTSIPERSRQSETTNYEVSKLVRHTVQPKGSVRRISVAVLLDNKTVQTQTPDGKLVTTSKPIPQQDLDAYKELVYAAVGFDKERGDIVTLENVPFYTEPRPVEKIEPTPWYQRLIHVTVPPGSGWQTALGPAMKYLTFIVLFLLVYLILFRPIKKRVFATLEGIAPQQAQEQTAPQLAEGTPEAALPPAAPGSAGVSAVPALGEGAQAEDDGGPASQLDKQIEQDFLKEAQMLDIDGRKYTVLKKRLTEKAQKEPEMAAQLVRSWIQER